MTLPVAKFLEQFFLEARDKLTHIQNLLVEMENNNFPAGTLLELQRNMHTIKGSARMVGLQDISRLAHLLEDLFAKLHETAAAPRAETLNLLYRGVDTLGELVNCSESGQNNPDWQQLENDLQLMAANHNPVKPSSRTRRFTLDFRSLRDSLKKGAKHTASRPPPPAEAEATILPGSEAVPAVTGAANVAPAKPASEEKTYLRIHTDKIDTLVNQVTDLFTKKYLFATSLQSWETMAKTIESIKMEWLAVKSGAEKSIAAKSRESIEQMDAMLEIFRREVHEANWDFRHHLLVFENMLHDIYDSLLNLKLVPLATVFAVYPRFVRDYANRMQKKIQIYLRGGDVELDKTIIERIHEPLVHLIRNACDHGIEPPAEREQLGKNATGTIIVEASKKVNRVQIRISDDGHGLDREKIYQTAQEKNLLPADRASELSDDEINALIFEPELSTSQEISETSGRGLGMDIVKKAMQQLNGSISLQNEPGEGVTFLLEFPVSIFTSKVLFVREEGKTFAIPSALIKTVTTLPVAEIRQQQDRLTMVWANEAYTVAKLHQILFGQTAGFSGDTVHLIMPRVVDKKIGILVDELLQESEVIIKGTGTFLGKHRHVQGLVIGDRGEVEVVLDLHDIADSPEFSQNIRIAKMPTREKRRSRILVVDDSLLVREMEKNLLESAGYEVITAVSGSDGLNKAMAQHFDLILADIEMPEMDGFEMIEQLRLLHDYAETPTIVLSMREKEEDKIRGIKAGANAWISKHDFNDRSFLKVISSFLS